MDPAGSASKELKVSRRTRKHLGGWMPTYDYRCPQGHEFEKFQRMSDDPVAACPKCGEDAERVISGGAGFLFKGEGFYITDYRSEEYKKKASAEKKKAGAGGSSEGSGAGGQGSSGGGESGTSAGAGTSSDSGSGGSGGSGGSASGSSSGSDSDA